ncbi:MAG: hypothetical protein AAFP17_19255 [Pseudomonadota bacterium]
MKFLSGILALGYVSLVTTAVAAPIDHLRDIPDFVPIEEEIVAVYSPESENFLFGNADLSLFGFLSIAPDGSAQELPGVPDLELENQYFGDLIDTRFGANTIELLFETLFSLSPQFFGVDYVLATLTFPFLFDDNDPETTYAETALSPTSPLVQNFVFADAELKGVVITPLPASLPFLLGAALALGLLAARRGK